MLPGFSVELAATGIANAFLASAVSFLLAPVVAWIAVWSRGEVAAIAFSLVMLALGNLFGKTGWAEWFPYSIVPLLSVWWPIRSTRCRRAAIWCWRERSRQERPPTSCNCGSQTTRSSPGPSRCRPGDSHGSSIGSTSINDDGPAASGPKSRSRRPAVVVPAAGSAARGVSGARRRRDPCRRPWCRRPGQSAWLPAPTRGPVRGPGAWTSCSSARRCRPPARWRSPR